MRNPNTQPSKQLPPGQQLVAAGKWPVIGEREPAPLTEPWTLKISGLVEQPHLFSLEQLRELPQTSLVIDIHCVTRWSKLGVEFSGVLLKDLLELAQPTAAAKFISFVAHSNRNHSTSLRIEDALACQTLIALDTANQPIEDGHGGPLRNIVPGRYFYKSVKWLKQIELLEQDRLGYWEAETGYHNLADPWKEQRYMASSISRREVIALLESRDFSNRDLRSISAMERDLANLVAVDALLRDADFTRANLTAADFSGANLSNAHFLGANLAGAKLVNADVEGADFSGADLRGADLTGCSLIGSSFFSEIDGQLIEATIDSTTIMPEAILEPLFPPQLAFVKQRLA